MFFRKGLGVIADAEGIAENGDFYPFGLCRQRRGHNDGRRHEAIGILVVFVDANAVEAEFLGVFQFVQITVVKLMTLSRSNLVFG